ncbi:hypothetical protein [Legionella sp. km772]|uniref:hypothetical protein n=1 Tax=Legionella sp. km772 TaxID=2498111 RepID=UPI000F8D45E8|nr:hypothetical protein [Legionella sp. km772]RUR10256.1 hypothetical protein ELY15_08410 [Legionella sp. km772]
MKKIRFLTIAYFFSTQLNAASVLPSIATINFTLNNIEQGSSCPSLLNNSLVKIYYEYDFKRNMGLAFVKQLQATKWTEVLHPLGISSVYGFMSDMAPKIIPVQGGDVVVYRVIFNLEFNGDSQVRLMLGEQGDCIMSSNIVNVNK